MPHSVFASSSSSSLSPSLSLSLSPSEREKNVHDYSGDLVTAALTRSHERKGTRPPIRSTAAGSKRMVLSITCLQKCKHPYDAMRAIHNGVNSKHFGFKIHFWVLMVKELMTPILHDRESVSCSTRGHRIEYTSLHGNYRWVGCILWDSARTADS